MKKTIIITIVVAIIALIVFNKLTSNKRTPDTFTEVKKGLFEITVTNSGELLPESSLEIKGPELGGGSGNDRDRRGGSRGGGFDMHAMELKILDIVPEGTVVEEGDYIARLDRTNYDNTLKDEIENLTTLQANLEMKVLDTAMALTNLRDDIKNQKYVVEEATIVLEQSKFEPPATIRQAEISLDKAQRTLQQKEKSYELKVAQNLSQISREKRLLSRGTQLVEDIQNYLAEFTITAPSAGMVIYKKERNGGKIKAGSSVNPFDLVIATLPDLSSMISKIYVSEIEVSKVKPGLKVNIEVDAFPEKAYTGSVSTIANIGEQLPNSDSKMFEVLIKVDGYDPSLRPSMTTGNKIIIKAINDCVFIPNECVHTGSDGVPYVYEKNGTKQIVVLGESNDKNVVVKQGLEPGETVYLITPENPEKFRLVGENLIASVKEGN